MCSSDSDGYGDSFLGYDAMLSGTNSPTFQSILGVEECPEERSSIFLQVPVNFYRATWCHIPEEFTVTSKCFFLSCISVQFVLITKMTHFCMCLFHFCTCFEQTSAHHQENQLYQYIIWYISLRVGGRLVCRLL
jgi:hypothetical protein